MAEGKGEPPLVALQAALKASENVAPDTPAVRGYSFPEATSVATAAAAAAADAVEDCKGAATAFEESHGRRGGGEDAGARGRLDSTPSDVAVDYDALMRSFRTTGFQATCLANAVDVVNRMLDWRLSNDAVADDARDDERDPAWRATVRCKVFLGFTSNLMSSGLRETICFLARHKMVDVIVTTAGGIEEDLIKCLAPTYLGDFSLPGRQLRARGLNRIGNLLVPNANYCAFEDWCMPLLDEMLKEQKEQGVVWAPSSVIRRLAQRINDESSVLYWAYKNDISVYCPGLTDGSLGDMIYFHSYRNPGLVIDLVSDIRRMNSEAVHAAPRKTGVVVLGGGLPKHHICNANMMRNGADFAVYINTANEFDGSDSGARPDEAVSWGKIRPDAEAIKVQCDATIAFPLLVAQTFAKHVVR